MNPHLYAFSTRVKCFYGNSEVSGVYELDTNVNEKCVLCFCTAWLSIRGILGPLESMKASCTGTGFSQWHILLFLSPQIRCLSMNIIDTINCTWSWSELCD